MILKIPSAYYKFMGLSLSSQEVERERAVETTMKLRAHVKQLKPGLPGGSNQVKSASIPKLGVQSRIGKRSLEERRNSHPLVFLSEFTEGRLVGYSLWGYEVGGG